MYSERVSGLEGEGWLGHGSPVRVAMKRFLLILSIGLALPGVAKAGTVVTPNVTMVSRDVPGGNSITNTATDNRQIEFALKYTF